MANEQTSSSDAGDAAAGSAPEAEDGADLQDSFQQLQFAAAESYEKLAEAAAQLTEQAHSVYLASQDSVRRNPIGYGLGAFALGCILGVLLGRD